MKIREMSIQWQWRIISFLLVTIPVLTLGVWAYTSSKKELYASTEDQLKNQVLMVTNHIETGLTINREKLATDLKIAHKLFYDIGTPELDDTEELQIEATNQVSGKSGTFTIPTMKIAGAKIAHSYDIVDNIQEFIGGTVTIFQIFPQGALRISTNVLKDDGSRAVGTYIPLDSPVYQTAIKGDVFSGRAYVVNDWYQTMYEPILDNYGNVIGILYVGTKDAAEPILDSLADVVVGKTGYVWILNKEGEYVLSLKRLRDGENISAAQDAEGRYFVKGWIEQGPLLKEDEVLIDHYPWQNLDESFPRMKVVAYAYFNDLEWIVGSGMYIDDFDGSLEKIWRITVGVSVVAIVFGFMLANWFVASLVNNFKKIASAMRDVAMGNLSKKIEVQEKNEIGEMAEALNDMKTKIRSVLEEMNDMIQSIHEGRFDVRGDSERFDGVWRELADGLNTLIDAFVEPIGVTTEAIDRMAQGDISSEVTHEFQGDFNKIQERLNLMIAQFKNIVGDVKTAADQVALSSQRLRVRSKEISEGAAKQASTAEQVSASMQEMSANIRQNAENALQTKSIAVKSAEDAHEGGQIVIQTVEAMQKIAKRISIIEELANQTHMLSLNATIEAAKAQDHGKGFAVVASEVRSLAERSRIAAEEIGELTDSSMTVAEKAGDTLEKVVPDIQNTARLIEEISFSTSEQSSGAQYINQAVQQLDHTIQQNVVMADEITTTANLLADQAEQLQQAIHFFKVGTDNESVPSLAEEPSHEKKLQENEAVFTDDLDRDANGNEEEQKKLSLDDEFERF